MKLTDNQATIVEWSMRPDIYMSPYKFAMTAYSWGKGDLKNFTGPRRWQIDVMKDIEEYLHSAVKQKKETGTLPDFFRFAMASGRGPGKSALVGILAHWFMTTRLGGSVWVAANGEPQLRTKTFPEIAKWFARGINSECFDIASTSITPASWFKNYIESNEEGLGANTRYYYVSGQLWSAENPDAFAGAHNFSGEMAIFDEASGIPDSIWAVQEGVFTEAIVDRFWLAFSNPRNPDGAFYECFHKNRNLWRTRQLDSRTVEGISQTPFENIITKYGEDSDEARIEVYGQFPNTGDRQFIGKQMAEDAAQRKAVRDEGAPLVMGVDVARQGKDRSVIAFRRGRDARTIPWRAFQGLLTDKLVDEIVQATREHNPSAIFVDATGLGGPVVDMLKLRGIRAIEVHAGTKPDDGKKYRYKREELWDRMREWLYTGSIPDNKDLLIDLTAPHYSWHKITGQLVIESKDDMKKRGQVSPDYAEALLQTFAKPVARVDMLTSLKRHSGVRIAEGVDDSVFN